MSKVADLHTCVQNRIFCECLHGDDSRRDTMSKVADLHTCVQNRIFCGCLHGDDSRRDILYMDVY